jgi:translation initiation factor 3 subunit A
VGVKKRKKTAKDIMVVYFAKPESALARAADLVKAGESEQALEILQGMMASKKHRQQWTLTHEKMMLLLVDLCVAALHPVRDALNHYRNITAAPPDNPASLEMVVEYYLKAAHARVEAALARGGAAALARVAAIDDLDATETPASLLARAASSTAASSSDDASADELTPLLRYQWGAFWQVLDALRNNVRHERLYADVAERAFAFCARYQRRVEFRRLCDQLRHHLSTAIKYQTTSAATAVDLAHPESLRLVLQARFKQISTAAEMGLWQEAFKATEEVAGFLFTGKTAPRPQMLAQYFTRLARVRL